mmetsp:Transcript_2189/g.3953  ORF Transcript_2189/g.3953 Transcript_2189/m.3953 type:complete len:103 (+) Transcript_2189:66-374(+)
MVISAPTGSGKTAVFELAICKLLVQIAQEKGIALSKVKSPLGCKIMYVRYFGLRLFSAPQFVLSDLGPFLTNLCVQLPFASLNNDLCFRLNQLFGSHQSALL